jgi:hypothetical protein
MVRASRIHLSQIALYWAVLTFGLALFWAVALNAVQASGVGPAFTLVVPIVLGGIISVLYYFARSHIVLEYDDEGYQITKGKKHTETHTWSEFKECSVIRDGYGRNKVRAYTERDGKHFDVDTPTCGIDPYAFRDFMASRIRPHIDWELDSSSTPIFAGLEREIQRGRASWVADLNETFRDYQISGERFPLIARGSTRPKGFLLSRFVAVTMMPNYQVCLYAHDISRAENASKARILRLIRIIESQRDEKDIKWSWLLLFRDQEPPEHVSKLIQEFGNKDVGIGSVDISTGDMITSPTQLGASLRRQMRLNYLIRDLKKRRHTSA